MSFTENNGLFKRAFDLAENDVDKHRKLYNMLSDFVIENEISHNDNAIVFKKSQMMILLTYHQTKLLIHLTDQINEQRMDGNCNSN